MFHRLSINTQLANSHCSVEATAAAEQQQCEAAPSKSRIRCPLRIPSSILLDPTSSFKCHVRSPRSLRRENQQVESVNPWICPMRILSLPPTVGINIRLKSIHRNASPLKWQQFLPPIAIASHCIYPRRIRSIPLTVVINIHPYPIHKNAFLICLNPLYHCFRLVDSQMRVHSLAFVPQPFENIPSVVEVVAVVVVVRASVDRMDSRFQHPLVIGYETILHHSPIDRFTCNARPRISIIAVTRPRVHPMCHLRVNRENLRHPSGSHPTKSLHRLLWRKHRWTWVPRTRLLPPTADIIIRHRRRSKVKNVLSLVLLNKHLFARRDHHLRQRTPWMNNLTPREKTRRPPKQTESLLDLTLIYDTWAPGDLFLRRSCEWLNQSVSSFLLHLKIDDQGEYVRQHLCRRLPDANQREVWEPYFTSHRSHVR